MNNRKIHRGDIFLYDFGENAGSIQNGYRPVLVVQADDFNANAPTVIVAAITSVTSKRYLPSHILIGEGFGLTKPSMVMLEQQLTVNKDKLTNFIGHIDSNNISRKIHNGLMVDSFEEWYANQFHYKKVDGSPPGQNWQHTMSIRETADILGIAPTTVYSLIDKELFIVLTVSGKKRIDKKSFEEWYANQSKYHRHDKEVIADV